MQLPFQFSRAKLRAAISGLAWVALALLMNRQLWAQTQSNLMPVVIVEIDQGSKVEVSRAGKGVWDPAYTNQVLQPKDLLRTGPRSRATLRLSDQSLFRVGELSDLEIQPPPENKKQASFGLLKGLLYFLHSEKIAGFRINTRTASAAIRGTEFNLEVTEQGRTILTLINGSVELSNDQGPIDLVNGQQGIAEPGKRPTRTAVIAPINVIQWCLYYPGVLDLKELALAEEEKTALAESLAAYKAGDLLQALAKYPAARQPGSVAERIYLSALLLAVGQAQEAERALTELNQLNESNAGLVAALRNVIAAVKLQPAPPAPKSSLSSSLLAESYYLQSRASQSGALEKALRAARQAVERSPDFGFGWARVAELEFSFGRTKEALNALDKSLALAPRNAQALALKGFLLSAENKIPEAITNFNAAMAIDGGLGNAWLGRGLCRIRQGTSQAGREDLQVAATLEPQRALLRSYLAKAYDQTGDSRRARQEIQLAEQLDPADPTGWFYSALLNQQSNRVNQAVRDLEKSQDLNENRQLYRSRFLLDQDRAVRSVNLASIYRDAGMFDVSVREAARAANSDYANYSAHLFLANSYNELRDPNLINLRYETATFSEYLLANLLAPVGGSALSPYVSQQEYVRLFETERPRLSSDTTYLSRGSWQQNAALYGAVGNTGYALDVAYRDDAGQRPNNDLRQIAVSPQFKQEVTPEDSVYFQAIYTDQRSGDLRQYYDPAMSSGGLRVRERQEPNFFAGYHHEWSPNSHTLFLFGRLNDRLDLTEPSAGITVFFVNTNGHFVGLPEPGTFDLSYENDFNAYTTELQQILQAANHTLIFGARYQTGETRTESDLGRGAFAFPPVFGTNLVAAAQSISTDLQRVSFYGYDQWRLWDPFWLTAGVSYDRLRFPENINLPPISGQETQKDQVSPKAGFIWKPFKNTAVRFAYTRSLGGLFYDTSVRLEPVQIAGFNQAFRSLIPESVEGPVAGSKFETFSLALDQKFATGTYLGVQAELLDSKAERLVGEFERVQIVPFPPAAPSETRQNLEFEEKSLTVSLNQLIAAEWSLGARYKLSHAELKERLPAVSPAMLADAQKDNRALLHQLNLFGIYNHPSGFFTQFQSLWTAQNNTGYATPLPGDDFWQFNAFAGYRFPRRRAEVTLGLLNIADQDYRLNPLNLYLELPRHRTLAASFRFYF